MYKKVNRVGERGRVELGRCLILPYSGKLSREKTFAFRSKTRISQIKLSQIAPVGGPANEVTI